MTTVAMVPVVDARGEKADRVVAGDQRSVGKTTGQALDALTAQLDPMAVGGLLFVQGFQPDAWFTAARQERLAELMRAWRAARDRGEEPPPARQAELDGGVSPNRRKFCPATGPWFTRSKSTDYLGFRCGC